MQHVGYTATREIATGHSVDTEYTLDLQLAQKTPSGKARKTVQYSLSNKAAVTFHNVASTWKCLTIPLAGTDREYMREFLYSVLDQVFSFDPDNEAGASPTAQVNCVLVDGTVTETRAARTGTQANDYFKFSFTIRQVS